MAPATCCGVASQWPLNARNAAKMASCGVRSPAPRATRGESRKRASRSGSGSARGCSVHGRPVCRQHKLACLGGAHQRVLGARVCAPVRPAAVVVGCSVPCQQRAQLRLNVGGSHSVACLPRFALLWVPNVCRPPRQGASTQAAADGDGNVQHARLAARRQRRAPLIAAATDARAQPSRMLRMLRQRVQRCLQARAAPSRYDVLRLCCPVEAGASEARAQQAPEHARRQRGVGRECVRNLQVLTRRSIQVRGCAWRVVQAGAPRRRHAAASPASTRGRARAW